MCKYRALVRTCTVTRCVMVVSRRLRNRRGGWDACGSRSITECSPALSLVVAASGRCVATLQPPTSQHRVWAQGPVTAGTYCCAAAAALAGTLSLSLLFLRGERHFHGCFTCSRHAIFNGSTAVHTCMMWYMSLNLYVIYYFVYLFYTITSIQ